MTQTPLVPPTNTKTVTKMSFVDAVKLMTQGRVIRSIDTFLFISPTGELWSSQGPVWAWVALGHAAMALIHIAVFEAQAEHDLGADYPGWFEAFGVSQREVLDTRKVE